MPLTIQSFQREINTYYFRYSIGSKTGLKEECLVTVKKLGTWLDKDKVSSHVPSVTSKKVLQLCNSLIELYDTLKKSQQDSKVKLLCYDDIILWINSKEQELFCPPYDHTVGLFLDDDNELDIPTGLDYSGLNDLYQESAANCSFVASLLSISNCNTHLFDDILIHDPIKHSFAVKLYFNSSQRSIILSTELPETRDKLINSTSNRDLVWPCLIEKAYLKLYGYDLKDSNLFHGSNFASDSFLLTGWIPQFLPIGHLTRDLLWEVYESYKNEKVLLGLGTGDFEVSDKQHPLLKNIAPNHDFAIIDIVETEKSDLGLCFTIKNPWLNHGDRVILIDTLEAFGIIFETFYINWNPGIFKYSTKKMVVSSLKSTYNIQGPTTFMGNHQQYSFFNDTDKEQLVWVLIEKSLSSNFIIDTLWYIKNTPNEKVFDKNLSKACHESYDNGSRFQLCKLKIPSAKSVTGVFIESTKNVDSSPNFNKRNESGKISTYSISSFSNINIKIEKSLPFLPFEFKIDGHWEINAGGNFTVPGFIENPQFEIFIQDSLDREVEVKIGLLTDHLVQSNLLLFMHNHTSKFPFKTSFEPSSLVFNQKTEYSRGGVFYDSITLSTNQKYIAIPSTYTPVKSSVEKFQIFINSPIKSTKITPINCSLGLFTKTLNSNWQSYTNVNIIKFGVKHRTKILAHIKCLNYSFLPSIKATLYSYVADNCTNPKNVICTTGDYISSIFGIFLGGVDVEISEGIYCLVVERSNKSEGEYSVEIGSSTRINIYS